MSNGLSWRGIEQNYVELGGAKYVGFKICMIQKSLTSTFSCIILGENNVCQ